MKCQFRDDDFHQAILDMVAVKDGQALVIQVVGGATVTGFAPVSVGRDYLRCQVSAGDNHKEQIVPFHSITCIR